MINLKLKNPNLFITIIVIIFLCLSFNSFTQVIINGANVHSLNNSIIYIQTDSLLIESDGYFQQEGLLVIDKDLIVNSGKLDVDGTIDIEKNLLNNDSIEGFSASSLIRLNGNWINNNTFIPGLNTTELDGNVQSISGVQITSFFNLTALGGIADVKSLINVNAIVQNNLNLTDVEFATNQNNLSVTNPSVNAIIRNNGFVSSLDTGKLERVVNSTATYLFPTGSSDGFFRYRPIQIIPNNNIIDTYGVRLANVNATTENFSVDVLEDSLCLVNPNFYHRIYGDKKADIQMFYLPLEDGEWSDMAHWQNSPQWEDMGNESVSSIGGFTSLNIKDWDNFSYPAYALAIRAPYLNAGNDFEALFNENVDINPIYIGPSVNYVNWSPNENLDCADCINTVANLSETTEFIISINEGEKCAVSDTITIYVIPGQLFLPSGFSPNGDGVNDAFKPMNTDIETFKMSIWNRWGEMIFETEDYKNGWNGTYKGTLQNIGVFTYYVEYRFKGQDKDNTQKGNTTLIR